MRWRGLANRRLASSYSTLRSCSKRAGITRPTGSSISMHPVPFAWPVSPIEAGGPTPTSPPANPPSGRKMSRSPADAMILNNSDQDSLQREVDRLLRQWECFPARAPSRGVRDDGQSAEFSPECHGRSRNATAFPPAAGRLPPKDRVPAGEVHQCLKPSPTPRSPPVQLPLRAIEGQDRGGAGPPPDDDGFAAGIVDEAPPSLSSPAPAEPAPGADRGARLDPNEHGFDAETNSRTRGDQARQYLHHRRST